MFMPLSISCPLWKYRIQELLERRCPRSDLCVIRPYWILGGLDAFKVSRSPSKRCGVDIPMILLRSVSASDEAVSGKINVTC